MDGYRVVDAARDHLGITDRACCVSVRFPRSRVGLVSATKSAASCAERGIHSRRVAVNDREGFTVAGDQGADHAVGDVVAIATPFSRSTDFARMIGASQAAQSAAVNISSPP